MPRTWDPEALATLELPNAALGVPAKHVEADYYYRIPVMEVFRSYPVYRTDREPQGYLARLAETEPQPAFVPANLVTRAEWVAAGEVIFHWPINLTPFEGEAREGFRQGVVEMDLPTAADGIMPFYRYVVREKGKLELGRMSCAMCHSRVLPDGTVISGAQGNFPFDPIFGPSLAADPPEQVRAQWNSLFGLSDGVTPPAPFPLDLTSEEMAALHLAIPPGVMARHGTSPVLPVQIPDLIGIAERRYLDRTGLIRHRGIGDLMRYGALNQGLDFLSDYGGFVPALASLDAIPEEDLPPGISTLEELRALVLDPAQLTRYSDEMLYALSLYLYDLSPPPSPHPLDERALRGREVFAEQDCASCHTPPLYTSNELLPAPGFRVPAALRLSDEVRSRGVGTDPGLTLATRRGTGFYKVPSLKGVWYRGPFVHDGSIATLEDWFDPARLADGYVPTGWNPRGGARAVRGHEFGLGLSAEDRAALIAFLRTL